MNWFLGRMSWWMLSGWIAAAIFAGQAAADCFSVIAGSPEYSISVICTNGTNITLLRGFTANDFVPNGEACDDCPLTNATITATGCTVLSYNPTPLDLDTNGGLAIFALNAQALPGFTNAQIVVNTSCYSFTNSFTFSDPALPTVPVFGTVSVSQNIYVGDETDFSADVCDATAYQWQKNNVNLTNNAHVSGADTALLTIRNTQMTDDGDYTLIASNSVGSTNWDAGYLTVSDPTATFDPPEILTNGFQLSISSVPDLTYIVQTATNLNGANWSPICTNVAPFIYIDAPSNNVPRRFYRAVYVPAL